MPRHDGTTRRPTRARRRLDRRKLARLRHQRDVRKAGERARKHKRSTVADVDPFAPTRAPAPATPDGLLAERPVCERCHERPSARVVKRFGAAGSEALCSRCYRARGAEIKTKTNSSPQPSSMGSATGAGPGVLIRPAGTTQIPNRKERPDAA